MDTRRKLTYYVHPDDYAGDKLLCDELNSLGKSEKSRLLRAATLAGFALYMQDKRIPYMLSELLSDNTSMDEIYTVISSVKPDVNHEVRSHASIVTLLEQVLSKLNGSDSLVNNEHGSQEEHNVIDSDAEETKRNAQSMFNIRG